LQAVCSNFVRQPQATTFLLEIKNNATRTTHLTKGKLELISTIAASRAEHVPGNTTRMYPDENRSRAVWLAHDEGDLRTTYRITEHDQISGYVAFEGNRGRNN